MLASWVSSCVRQAWIETGRRVAAVVMVGWNKRRRKVVEGRGESHTLTHTTKKKKAALQTPLGAAHPPHLTPALPRWCHCTSCWLLFIQALIAESKQWKRLANRGQITMTKGNHTSGWSLRGVEWGVWGGGGPREEGCSSGFKNEWYPWALPTSPYPRRSKQ